jgi:hypothetical protein
MDEPSLEDAQLAHLVRRRDLFAQVAAGWPPRVRDAAQLRELQALMTVDLGHARGFVAEHPANAAGRRVCADLLRMAHNLDVPGAAQEAATMLGALLDEDPGDAEAALCRGSLLVTLSPRFGAQAEADFRRAIAGGSTAASALQGLGFACLHQGRHAEALEHFRSYLARVPADASIASFVARMEAGEVPRAVQQPVGAPMPERAGTAAEAAPAPPPRWQFWRRR